MRLSPEVSAALLGGAPIVALESTVITHGLPYPENLRTARAMEEAVRAAGAVAATVALLGGQPTIGLDEGELEHLAQTRGVRKCSTRDLPIVMAQGLDGATTVSATMALAYRAGIRVFATGGIGGVHRGHPFDVSADLEQLGRTPMVVVCSGAKALLDQEATHERLETLGVPIIGYGTGRLPAFYSRETAIPVDVQVSSAEETANLIRARDSLQLGCALLVVVPVPVADEWPAAESEPAIAQAIALAEEQGIRGQAVTPFLLSKIAELSLGRSLRANLSLLVNNAQVGGGIAVALAAHAADS